jgi:hypothetical protein
MPEVVITKPAAPERPAEIGTAATAATDATMVQVIVHLF